MIKVIYDLIFLRLRLSEPWKYKAPFLISIPYFFIFCGNVSFRNALLSILFTMCTIIGFAGFGYFSNDIADRKSDLKAGVPNGTLDLNNIQVLLLFVFFLTAALLPWIWYFPVNLISVSLLGFQFLLFLAYVLPPLRLKERGLSGPVTDALYAHVNPALLLAYTFHLLTNQVCDNFLILLITLGIWQFFLGLRNILVHQMEDAQRDRDSGTKTCWITSGDKVYALMKQIFIPLEILGFIAFTIVLSFTIPFLSIAWTLYLFGAVLIIKFHWHQKLFSPLFDRLYFYFDEYFLRWFPLILIGRLIILDYRMSLLLLLHLLLFKNGLTDLIREIFHFRIGFIQEWVKSFITGGSN